MKGQVTFFVGTEIITLVNTCYNYIVNHSKAAKRNVSFSWMVQETRMEKLEL